MKIENSSFPLPLSVSPEGKSRTAGLKTQDSTEPTLSSGVNVNLGATAALKRSIENSGTSPLPFSTAKIADIKQAISEGRIQVNAGAIADSLIRSVTDLIASQPA